MLEEPAGNPIVFGLKLTAQFFKPLRGLRVLRNCRDSRWPVGSCRCGKGWKFSVVSLPAIPNPRPPWNERMTGPQLPIETHSQKGGLDFSHQFKAGHARAKVLVLRWACSLKTGQDWAIQDRASSMSTRKRSPLWKNPVTQKLQSEDSANQIAI